ICHSLTRRESKHSSADHANKEVVGVIKGVRGRSVFLCRYGNLFFVRLRVMKPFGIRDITIDPPLILSPMAGVTDYVFRRLIKRRGGVGLVVSEFISVEGLTRHNPKSQRQMRFDEEERPFAVQIFGGKADRMAMGAEM